MSCATTIEEKGGDSGRRDAKGNLALGTNGCGDGVADVSLSTTSCAVKEKQLSPVVVGRVHDLVECLLLLRIELGIIVLDPLKHLYRIISELLSKVRVVHVRPPLLLGSVHVLYVRETLSLRLYGDVLKEIKAIIENVVICGIQMAASDEPVT